MQLCPTNRSFDIMSAHQPASPPGQPAMSVCVQRQERLGTETLQARRHAGRMANLTCVHADGTNACRKKKKKGRERQWPRERALSPLEPHGREGRKSLIASLNFSLPPQSPTAAKHCAPGPAPYQIEVSVGGRRGSRIGTPVRGRKRGTAEPQASRMGVAPCVCVCTRAMAGH